MPDYLDGKRENREVVQHVNVEKTSQPVDIDALASAVAKAIGTLPAQRIGTGGELVDTFNDEKSLERLAESMIVQRGDKNANFDDLGKVKETKKDVKDTDAVRDILKGLD